MKVAFRWSTMLMGPAALAAFALALTSRASADADDISRPILPPTPTVSSTVPSNGDVNPYGVAFVPSEFPQGGPLHPGDFLVSNFNNNQNLQGTGTTIVRVEPNGHTSLFFESPSFHSIFEPPPPVGLTTALVILKAGFVIVGGFPSTDGTCQHASPGQLAVLDASGHFVTSLTVPISLTEQLISGPWDMAADDEGDHAALFVANALTGNVLRLDVEVGGGTVSIKDVFTIAGGYVHRCDPVTFVVAPTGLAYDKSRDVLFVASTGDNAVFEIENAAKATTSAGKGHLIYSDNAHLHGALAMVLGPCGHLFVSNNDGINPDPNQPSEIVEFTTGGKFISQYSVDPAPGGAFGVGLQLQGDDFIRFAAVDDNKNNVTAWTLPIPECSGSH
ncbi:MAG TPA: hypothetical protein VMK12_12405 [Anaeromyxobacteraceae bacterium]|nr:hypothetical protein [Anaeromyxobacteraceae bacterium]